MNLHIRDIPNSHRNAGQTPVVILAATIIEDISELCTQMAILNRGEMLFEADLRRAIEECHHAPAVHS